MPARRSRSAAPGPLEDYAPEFDDLFGVLAQREGLRAYLQGLLHPGDRNTPLTGLVGTEPRVGAQAAPAQRLPFFLSDSSWDGGAVNRWRLDGLWAVDDLRPHAQGVRIVDDTGDRKAGSDTAYVARQYLGSIGKLDNGIVAVTTGWADEHVYYPLHCGPLHAGQPAAPRAGGPGLSDQAAARGSADRPSPERRFARRDQELQQRPALPTTGRHDGQ